MAKVSIEVRSGAARFNVAVQAESIKRAVSFARGRYPKAYFKVGFPIEPESFFLEDPPIARRGVAALEPPARVAA